MKMTAVVPEFENGHHWWNKHGQEWSSVPFGSETAVHNPEGCTILKSFTEMGNVHFTSPGEETQTRGRQSVCWLT